MFGGHGYKSVVYLNVTVSRPLACDIWNQFNEFDLKNPKFELKYTPQHCLVDVHCL